MNPIPPHPVDYRRVAIKGTLRQSAASNPHASNQSSNNTFSNDRVNDGRGNISNNNANSFSQRPGVILNEEEKIRFYTAPQIQSDVTQNDLAHAIITLTKRCVSIVLVVASSVGLSIILLILYCVVRPFSRSYYRHLSQTLGATMFLDAMALVLPNTKICITGDSDVPIEFGTSVVVSNHMGEIDWWIIMMVGRCIGLKGECDLLCLSFYIVSLVLSLGH